MMQRIPQYEGHDMNNDSDGRRHKVPVAQSQPTPVYSKKAASGQYFPKPGDYVSTSIPSGSQQNY